MSTPEHNKISKFLSYVLRHKPDAIGLTLDDQGWADIDELINKANQSGEVTPLDQSLIQTVVNSNDKIDLLFLMMGITFAPVKVILLTLICS